MQLDLQLDLKRLGLGFFDLRSSWRCMFPAACRLALAAAAVGALIGAGAPERPLTARVCVGAVAAAVAAVAQLPLLPLLPSCPSITVS